MHVRKVSSTLRKQRGAGMVEIMAGLVVTGMMMAAAGAYVARSDAQTQGRADADSLSDFQQLAASYYSANRTNYQAALGGDATQKNALCRVNIAANGSGGVTVANQAMHTCTFDATLLRAANVWPTGKNIHAVGGGRWVAIARQLMSADPVPVPTGAEEILFVLAAEDTNGDVMTAGTSTFTGNVSQSADAIKAGMEALGGTGGFVPPGQDLGRCQYNATTKQVCGSGWVVSLSDFVN